MVKVRVEDVRVITVKPRIDKTVYQYVILTTDEYGHSEVFFIDADKYSKEKFVELVKSKYASHYRVSPGAFEVEFLVEPPRVEVSKAK